MVEKIQQAIERARQQRVAQIGQAAAAEAFAPASGSVAGQLEQCRQFALTPRQAQLHRLVAALPDDGRSDLFRMLRTQVRQRMAALSARSLAIFSARDREGKTTIACNLALSLAQQNTGPVFLLDFDFRRPSVHDVFGLDVERGLSALIEGTATLGEIAYRLDQWPLYVLPQGRGHPAASELIAAVQSNGLLQLLRDQVRDATIIVDCSPLLLTDEPLNVQQLVDGCLLVVQQGRTRRDDVQRVSELIDETKYVGSVLNQVHNQDLEASYGYGYR